MCTYIYIYKAKQLRDILCRKNGTLCKNQDNFCYIYLYINQDTLCYAIFHEHFEVGIVYKKHDTLRQVTFLYTKSQTLCTNQDNLRYVFVYKKPDTLYYTTFHGTFEIGGGGVGSFICKKNSLCEINYMQKTLHFVLSFIYKKHDTFYVIFFI